MRRRQIAALVALVVVLFAMGPRAQVGGPDLDAARAAVPGATEIEPVMAHLDEEVVLVDVSTGATLALTDDEPTPAMDI